MSGFSAADVEVGSFGKYQAKGISEKCVVTEVVLIKNEQYNTTSLQLKTKNENEQEGQSKRMSLKTQVAEGKKVSAWTVTAKNLLNILMSIGYSETEAKSVLEASSEVDLQNKLSKAMIGKPFRALFSSREYEPNKFAIELYVTEPVGGTKLVWDESNQYYNVRLPKAESVLDMPF